MKGRSNVEVLKLKKTSLFGDEEDDDIDSSLLNSISSSASSYRQEKEMMSSPTPSQLSTFSNKMEPVNFYGGTNFGLPQRGGGLLSNPSFQTSTTPTSSNIGGSAPTIAGSSMFPLNLQRTTQQSRPQQPVSPNRNMFNMGQHNLLTQLSATAQAQQQASLSFNHLKQRANLLVPSLLNATGNNFSRTLGDVSQPSLDWSDFPTLNSRSAQQNQLLTQRNYVGMVSKPQQEPAPEFQIQQEDFPALPGAQNPTASSNDSSSKSMTSMGSYDQALKDSGKSSFTDKIVSQTRRGIQTHSDGTVSNIPAGMVIDQFGIVGLLTFIRAAETDPNLVALAPGIDLTTLGLNLNSPDNLYSTFQSPWAEAPCRPQDIDYHVPSEYLTNVFIRDKLAPIKFNRYQEDLLFYLFYVNIGDVLQLAAAAELYNRDWRYHKEERVWITRAPGMEPLTKSNSYERGTYVFFDVHNWRKVPKEFYLEYSKLEDKPQLPDMHHAKTNN